MNQLRVLVADDNQSMRTAYKKILETSDNISVVGMAEDGQEALEQAIELVPDVAVLDVRMPKLDGLATANRIMAHDSHIAIVLVSAYDDLAFVRAIMHSGASRKAYLLKNSLDNMSEFIRVVEAVANGQAVLHGTIIQSLMDIYHRLVPTEATALTGQEEIVLKLMLEGHVEAEIAQALGMALDPVETLIASLCEKLGLDSEETGDSAGRSPRVVQAMVMLCVS